MCIIKWIKGLFGKEKRTKSVKVTGEFTNNKK